MRRTLLFAAAAVALVALSGRLETPVDAQGSAGRSWSAPRTPWGHPDLQGTYSNDDETGTPMERPRELEGKTLADIYARGAPEDHQGSKRTLRRGRQR